MEEERKSFAALTRDGRGGERNPFDQSDDEEFVSEGSEESDFVQRPRRRLTEEEKKDSGPPRAKCCKRCLGVFQFYPTVKQH